jgi:cardiolipin synthase
MWASGEVATHCQVLRGRREEWERRLRMIQEARRFLYATSYNVEYDLHGMAFLEALLAAQRRGVLVTLGIDTFGQRLGSYGLPPSRRRQLEEALGVLERAGGRVLRYRPLRLLQRWLGGGQHVKAQISDAGEAIVGSSNISTRSFSSWNECSVALAGPVVHRILESVMSIFACREPDHLDVLRASERAVGDPFPLEYQWHDPNREGTALHPIIRGSPNPITARLTAEIERATRCVRVSSLYLKPPPGLARALIGAAQRGVQVELFHSHRGAIRESELPWIAAAVEYPRFLRAGIRIFESRRGEHAKMLSIDDRFVSFGSYNLEHAADDRLAESMLMTTDPRLVLEIGGVFDAMRQDPHNVEVGLNDLAHISMRDRLNRALVAPFKRWL